jgi:hypothetical protein
MLAYPILYASRHKICADRGMQRIDRSFYLFSMVHNMEADLSLHAIKKRAYHCNPDATSGRGWEKMVNKRT